MTSEKKNYYFLAIALILCLISMIGVSKIQTAGGDIKIKDLRWETPSGKLMSALLFVPKNAQETNKAPAIVTSHGWYNNREMQDLNYVELSRRGYVVMAIDMYGHGNSEIISPKDWPKRGTGMYDAVELMATFPYVDKNKIAVTGHSNGARAANWSVKADNKKPKAERLIKSVLLIANDAMYTTAENEPVYWALRKEDPEYTNNYGSRDVGIIAAKYDEFFFRSKKENGGHTVPRNYIETEYAQSFLNFGSNQIQTWTKRENANFYEKEIEGEKAIRVIYTPNQIHPWNHFSAAVVKNTLNYFEKSLAAPKKIEASNQIWQKKVFFNFLGLIGFGIFIVSFTKLMLETKIFSSLKASEKASINQLTEFKGKLWFWGGSLLTAVIAAISYIKLYNWTQVNRPSFFNQIPTYYIGVWSTFMGIAITIIMIIFYNFYAKEKGFDLKDKGIILSPKNSLKTIALAFTVIVASFSLVFIADYFFKSDFRIWVLAVKAFGADKILIALKYLPLFLLFYIPNSISINSFNFVELGEKKWLKKEWLNTALLAFFNGLGPLVLVLIQYLTFFETGEVYFTSVSNIVGIWLFPIVVILPAAAIISRKIYRATKNPYLAGIINAAIVTMIMASNTLTRLIS
ncbi:alpha/beta hydrolase family protein [Halanaerobium praevalens]|uniref:Xaa-Pro dipeptidyl-peptidase-like domain-containing protein n=1 Tax=Halanaerobium praevalens (strain ATCC 33744 / DSM 2228 / GSL) TaxID=572479 RepID=E3DRV4_HALPG|nr:CocE/NonD family hydrolase [Halanaerobium praevalens]ADO78168.1 hypothetical protein Hprae_2047 [Halanaerobium praevalens DSM 2228]